MGGRGHTITNKLNTPKRFSIQQKLASKLMQSTYMIHTDTDVTQKSVFFLVQGIDVSVTNPLTHLQTLSRQLHQSWPMKRITQYKRNQQSFGQ